MSGDALDFEGTVVDVHRGGIFAVDVQHGGVTRRVLARVAGRLIQHHIKIVAGDLVQLECSPYDPTRGRITYRGRREERAL